MQWRTVVNSILIVTFPIVFTLLAMLSMIIIFGYLSFFIWNVLSPIMDNENEDIFQEEDNI